MRPDNIRQAITIFIRWQNPETGLVKPFRRVLTNCFVSEQGNQIAERTGIVLNQALFAQVFLQNGVKYFPLHEWRGFSEEELDGKWSVDELSPQSIFVPYIVGHEFDFGSVSQITTQENAFINSTPNAKRIAKIEPNMRGTERSRHVVLRC